MDNVSGSQLPGVTPNRSVTFPEGTIFTLWAHAALSYNWYATITCSTAFWDCKRYVAALQQMVPICPTLSLPFHASLVIYSPLMRVTVLFILHISLYLTA